MKYIAKCSEGQAIRTSDRVYTHAVLWIKNGNIVGANWCGNHSLAVKTTSRLAPDHRGCTCKIVEAVLQS